MGKEKIKVRNWLAVRAYLRPGGGAHKNKKKYTRKVKHKNKRDW